MIGMITRDIAVVGAGSLGCWTALQVRRSKCLSLSGLAAEKKQSVDPAARLEHPRLASLTGEDEEWISGVIKEAEQRTTFRIETVLLPAFHKWANHTEMRA